MYAQRLVLLFAVVPVVLAYTAYSECDRFSTGACTTPRPKGMEGVLRVGVAQTTSNSTATLEANAEKHAEWVRMAAAEKARMVVFPELSMTGYFSDAVLGLAGPSGSAETANARLRAAEDTVAAACKAHNIYAIIGVPVFWGDVSTQNKTPWYNTALVLTPTGERQYRQAKLYQCCTQDGTPGHWLDTFNITNFDGSAIPVALQICYDDFHPEIARLQAMAGAQILFYMSWESDVSAEWKFSFGDKLGSTQAVVNAHAAMNQLFILQANAGASTDNMLSEYVPSSKAPGIVMGGSHGQSRVIAPNGITLEQARVFGEQLLIHDLELELLSEQRGRIPMAGLDHRLFGGMWREGLKQIGPQNRMNITW